MYFSVHMDPVPFTFKFCTGYYAQNGFLNTRARLGIEESLSTFHTATLEDLNVLASNNP
jgi:hypothetical protein